MENPFGKTPPAPKVAEKPEMAEMLGVPKAVFFREIDHEGRPTGEPVLVRVSPNGSRIPPQMARTMMMRVTTMKRIVFTAGERTQDGLF